MITVFTGENSFEVDRALQAAVAAFDGAPEKIDGSTLTLSRLPDLLMGGTLFATKRLVIIKHLSDSKVVWTDLGDWLPRVSDDIELIIIEPKPDKRTKTYKELKKVATLRDFPAWTERDTHAAERWVSDEAERQGVAFDRQLIHLLVQRVGPDQWALYHALQKLSVLDVVTADVLAEVVEAQPSENVFGLFEAALKGNKQLVSQMIATLSLSEDPFRLFGLLSGQAFQLAALATSDVSSADVAKAVGAHPFALSKLTSHATRYGVAGARRVVAAFAEADSAMKSSAVDPWLLIERALLKSCLT